MRFDAKIGKLTELWHTKTCLKIRDGPIPHFYRYADMLILVYWPLPIPPILPIPGYLLPIPILPTL